jgi:hypothetical protein
MRRTRALREHASMDELIRNGSTPKSSFNVDSAEITLPTALIGL